MAKARRRRRVRLESLVRDSSTPVFLISVARKVVSFNAGCEALTGWSADDVRRVFVDNAMAFYGLSDASLPIDRRPSPRASAP